MRRTLAALLLTPLCAVPLLAQPKPREGRTYVFMVACSKYQNRKQWDALPYTVKEMGEFRQVLIDGGVRPEDIKFLRDPADDSDEAERFAPRKKNILDEFDNLVGHLEEADTLIVAINGHGIQPRNAKTGYFCPADSDSDKVETMIALEGDGGLYERLKGAKPKRKLLLVNACRNDPENRPPVQAAKLTGQHDDAYKFDAPEGIAALFSCRPGQFSFYYPPTSKVGKSPGHERSLFFHHLISAWRGEYGEAGKPVTLEDVFREVGKHTGEEADALLGDRQNPVVRREYSREWVVEPEPWTRRYDLTGGRKFAHFGSNGAASVLVTINDDKTKRFEAWVLDPTGGRPAVGPLKHETNVSRPVFSPDGRRVVTVSGNTARVWDAQTGKPLTPPLEQKGPIEHASFSPDGRRVVATDLSKTVRVWDVQTGKKLVEFLKHTDMVMHAAFSPEGRWIITGGWDRTPRVWDSQTGEVLTSLAKHDGPVIHVGFSPNGQQIVTASYDHKARIWDARTGKLLVEPLAHDESIFHVVFSHDGRRLVTASKDHTARIWDSQTGKPCGEPMRHDAMVRHAAFSPDGRKIVTTSDDRSARVWDAVTGRPLTASFKHNGPYPFLRVCFALDGKRVATTSEKDGAYLWDAETGKLLGSASVPKK